MTVPKLIYDSTHCMRLSVAGCINSIFVIFPYISHQFSKIQFTDFDYNYELNTKNPQVA